MFLFFFSSLLLIYENPILIKSVFALYGNSVFLGFCLKADIMYMKCFNIIGYGKFL